MVPLIRTVTTFNQHNIVLPNSFCYVQNKRYKSKVAKSSLDSEPDKSSLDSDERDEIQDKNTKILKINVTSLRVDGILKSSLGIARNKIETMFYENKIRINGEKLKKKSQSIQEGDEIDILKGPDIKNPSFMNVARVEILALQAQEESVSVKIKRCKSLTVDDYTK